MDANKKAPRFIIIYEVIKIRHINLAVLTITAIAIISVLIVGTVKGEPSQRLYSAPAHTVITKWYGDNGRRKNIHQLQIDEDIILHAKTEETGKCIILKTSNVAVKAYTKGKVLYECTETGRALRGQRITIIDAKELKKGAAIYLRLSPAEKKIGTIDAPIYSADVNEYLFTLLSNEKGTVIALAAMLSAFLISLSLFIFSAVFLRRKSPLPLLFCSANILSAMLLLSKSDLLQFFISSSEMKMVFSATAYILLPIVTATFLLTIIKHKLISANNRFRP